MTYQINQHSPHPLANYAPLLTKKTEASDVLHLKKYLKIRTPLGQLFYTLKNP
jgi:hypothetical protein